MALSHGPRRFTVLVNPGAGSGTDEAGADAIRDLFATGGVTATVTLVRDSSGLEQKLRTAIADGVDAIVAGGGDGTVSAAAELLIDNSIPLGVLPLGTLNHFARDLEIPLKVEDAIDVIVAGHTSHVDVGEVNGHIFINNSSLGLYPRIVRLRDTHSAHGVKKWAIASWATVKVLARLESLAVQVDADGEKTTHRTPMVVIGNNRYHLAGIDAGSRDSLREGELAVYVVKARSRRRLARLAWRILRGHPFHDGDLELIQSPEVTIEARGHHHHVALDGELVELTFPLEYRVRPRALRVFVPQSS